MLATIYDIFKRVKPHFENAFKQKEEASELALNISKQKSKLYINQIISLIDVNQSRIQFLDEKIESLQAKFEWLNAWIELYRALGGGWQFEEELCKQTTLQK